MVTARRRADARLPSHSIDAIDQSVAQLRGLFGVLSALSHPSQSVSFWSGDLGNLVWLLEDQLDILNEHAQALWAQAHPHSPKEVVQ